MPITYRTTQDFSAAELRDLFASVGWSPARYPERLKRAMANSDSVISAWDGDTLIGLINCLSDGVLTAYFHYLLIRPEYQAQGIGRELLRLMFERYSNCLRKLLIADSEQVGFYQKCEFTVVPGAAALFCDTHPEMGSEIE